MRSRRLVLGRSFRALPLCCPIFVRSVASKALVARVSALCSEFAGTGGGAPTSGLRDLLKIADLYDGGVAEVPVPSDMDRLRVCRAELDPKELIDVVDAQALPFARDPVRMIAKTQAELDVTPGCDVVPYMDPGLRAHGGRLRKLVAKLDSAGLIAYHTEVFSLCGLFAVPKRGTDLQRLVVDARPANALHRRPPYAALATGSAISGLSLALRRRRR